MSHLYLVHPVQAPSSVETPSNPGIRTYIGGGTVIKVVGQIRGLQSDGAKHVLARLTTSFGEWPVRASVSCMDASIGDGDWVCARLMTRHDASEPLSVMRAIKVASSSGLTSWLPLAPSYRDAGLAEMRRMLGCLEPALQGFFVGVLTDTPHAEKRMLGRPAALDHHSYPGGLFDQSLAAARLAQLDAEIAECDRGLLTLGALLFDIGKVTEPTLCWDSDRAQGYAPHPHRLTPHRLIRPLHRLALTRPALAAEIAELLALDEPPSLRMRGLRTCLARCVQQSWGDTAPLAQSKPTRHQGASR